MQEPPKIQFEKGQTYFACVEFWAYEMGGGEITIVDTFDEGYGQHVIYRAFGKNKPWWHYFVAEQNMLEFYIDQANKARAEGRTGTIGLAGFPKINKTNE